MISRKEFAAFQLSVEKRFAALERENQELKHRIEIEQLKSTLKNPDPTPVSDDEKKAAENAVNEQNRKFAEWSEDSETLSKLGLTKDS